MTTCVCVFVCVCVCEDKPGGIVPDAVEAQDLSVVFEKLLEFVLSLIGTQRHLRLL